MKCQNVFVKGGKLEIEFDEQKKQTGAIVKFWLRDPRRFEA
jgi:hypothetical protein